jgi:hypothetical protein
MDGLCLYVCLCLLTGYVLPSLLTRIPFLGGQAPASFTSETSNAWCKQQSYGFGPLPCVRGLAVAVNSTLTAI